MISIINDFGKRTGIGRYTNDIGRSLGDNGKIFSLIYARDRLDNDYPGIKVTGIYPRFLSTGWFFNFNFPQFTFRSFINQMKVSEGKVHFSNLGIKPFLIDERASVTLYDLIFLKKELIGDKRKMHYVRYIKDYKKMKRITAISKHVKRDLEDEGFDADIEVIYPAVSDNFKFLNEKQSIRKKMGLPSDRNLVLSVSTAEYRKNLRVVSETMDALGDQFSLVRVGSGLGDSYTFLNLTDCELNDLYNACDVLLFPTLEEGFGYPMAEAFAAGLPVVASDIEVLREVAGNSAILVNPNPHDCAIGVKDALSQEINLRDMGLKQSKQFSFDIFKRKTINFFGL